MASHARYHIQYFNHGFCDDTYHCTEAEALEIAALYAANGMQRVEAYQELKPAADGKGPTIRIVTPPPPPAVPTQWKIMDRFGRQVASRRAFTAELALDRFLEHTGEVRDDRGLYVVAA